MTAPPQGLRATSSPYAVPRQAGAAARGRPRTPRPSRNRRTHETTRFAKRRSEGPCRGVASRRGGRDARTPRPVPATLTASAPVSKCGLRRDLDTVRMSATCAISCSARSPVNASTECASDIEGHVEHGREGPFSGNCELVRFASANAVGTPDTRDREPDPPAASWRRPRPRVRAPTSPARSRRAVERRELLGAAEPPPRRLRRAAARGGRPARRRPGSGAAAALRGREPLDTDLASVCDANSESTMPDAGR
jgi:hypothetical protein